jgi:hypothetical protein
MVLKRLQTLSKNNLDAIAELAGSIDSASADF